MTDDSPLHARMQRANQAREILDNTLLKEAFTALRQTYLEAAMQTTFKDDMGRFRALQAALVVDQVQQHIARHIEDGKLAAEELKALQRGNDRRKMWPVV